MGNLRNSNNSQTSLFDKVDLPRLFFITTKRNLLSFLGSGMVVPAKSQFRYQEDSRELFDGAVALWKNGIPDIPTAFPKMDINRAAVIEFDPSHLGEFIQKGKALDQESVVVLNAPLPMASIKAVYLRSHEEIDDFFVRLTDDVVANRELFGVFGSSSSINVDDHYEIKKVSDPSNAINFVDRFGGAIRSVELLANSYSSGIDYVRLLSLLSIRHYGSGSLLLSGLNQNQEIPLEDMAIVGALLDILSKTYPEQGFDQDGVLVEIEEALQTLEPEHLAAFHRWLDFSRKIVSSEKELPELDDSGDIVKRGVLLFLMRPNLERLRLAASSSINPGKSVFQVATFLSGFFTGMTRLGLEYKGDFSEYGEFSRKLLEAFFCSDASNIESVYDESPMNGASLLLRVNGLGILTRNIERNVTLERVQSIGKSKGYELIYDYKKHRLSCDIVTTGDSRKKVFIELIQSLPGGYGVVRFISSCQDLSGSKRKKFLTKDRAMDLLLRNGRNNIYCTFAVSDSMAAIVVQATQIVHTMDDDELELLLNHVATVAADYENESP